MLPATEIDGLFLTNFSDCARDIQSIHLDDLLNVTDVCKVEGLLGDGTVIIHLLDLGILFKYDAKVVFNRSEAFISHFHDSV